MRDKGSFEFGGVSSEEFNIILTKAPPIIFAEKDVEPISVAGRSGNLIRDNGRYKNVTVPYDCAIIPKRNQNLRELAVSALSLLAPTSSYKRLENSFFSESFRAARVTGQLSIESIVERAGRFAVKFDCKPQRFLISGEMPLEYISPSFIVNPTGFNAKPLIVVYGTGPGTVTVGNKTVEIKALEDQIVLDSELMDAYRQVGDAAAENKNSCIYAPEFPELTPGENIVTWTGDITSLRITPRWWTL